MQVKKQQLELDMEKQTGSMELMSKLNGLYAFCKLANLQLKLHNRLILLNNICIL